MIDLRSDTMTRPSPGMREAMAAAEVGDEQYGEDPTVSELERRVAALLGQEAAVYLPTATMGNQIALSILGRPGDELLVEESAHIVVAELGGAARHSGLQLRLLRGERGRLSPAQVRDAYRRGSFHTPPTRILALENTHNVAGGAAWPLDELDATVAAARELELAVHLDGARLINAAVALGVPAARIAGQFDTVTLCLSKGLGCPMGALIAGSEERMLRARREKHAFGGALRQAGIVAAAGLYALEHNVDRLADDHRRAARLAAAWSAAGLDARAETNFVQVPVDDVASSVERLAGAGVLMSPTRPGVLRAVTHLDVGDDDLAQACELVPPALVR
jgi:threonine aldolase